jgi:hypothetical protein
MVEDGIKCEPDKVTCAPTLPLAGLAALRTEAATVIEDEVRVPVATALPEYWSEPEAEPWNVKVPSEDAVYVHTKF